MDKTSEKLDKIASDIGTIKIELAKLQVGYAEHIRRTHLAELRIESTDTQLRAMMEHIQEVRGMGRLLKWVSATIATAGSIALLLSRLGLL